MKNSDKLGGTKCLKELIFKGADKDIENSWGKKAIEYLNEVRNITLRNEIDKVLGD